MLSHGVDDVDEDIGICGSCNATDIQDVPQILL